MPKVSIIIPTHNSSLFIKRAINSVLNQTCKDWELLIVDDCSTDNTMGLASEFVKQDSRIKLLKTPQNSGGPAMPKNIGIENAQGEYVAFLDHDDEWMLTKLKKQLEVFENSKDEKMGIVSCHINIISSNGKLISKYNKNYKKDILKKLSKNNFIFTSSCVLVKSSIFKEIGLFDTKFKIADDFDMWLRIAKAGYRFDFSPEYLLNYISHKNNACFNLKDRRGAEYVLISEKHRDLFLKYCPRRVGLYYKYNGDNKTAIKYYLKSVFSKETDFEEIIKSIAFVILSFFPTLEKFFRKIYLKIKNIL